ncbi:MAG: hypothetical protein ACR2OC_02990 [Solirubrobacterales bacterium]
MARLEVLASLADAAPPPIYQQIAEKAQHLRELGMSNRSIGRALAINDKTVAKALKWELGR